MRKIRVIKAKRGFWQDLFSANFVDYKFLTDDVKSIEDIGKNSKSILWKISRLRILDVLGVFQKVRVNDTENVDIYFSYNRFLASRIPYVIALENPLALVHYSPKRTKTILGKRNLKKVFSNTNIKAVSCLSKACQSAVEYYYKIPEDVLITQIYPYIKDEITLEELNEKMDNETIKCLFISSDFNLKGGNELISAMKDARLINDSRIHLDIITKLNGINEEVKTIIEKANNIVVNDFSFTKEELNVFYKQANIFINTTRQDSFSLVTLEALKYGCAFIATDMYAIREMVRDNENGFLIAPSAPCWNEDNTYNEKLKQKERLNLKSAYVDSNISEFIGKKLDFLINNKEKLKELQQYSYKLATQGEFSKEFILNKWKDLFDRM